MVSELFINATQMVAVLWDITPIQAVYFYALLFSVFFAIVFGVASRNVFVGVFSFLGSLLVFSMLDAFPIWIILIPAVIVIVIGYYAGGGMD